MKQTDLLRQVQILEGLRDCEFSEIAKLCQVTKFEPGQQILEHTDTDTDVYFVLSGSVSARIFSEGGKEISYANIRSGEIFGEFTALDGLPRSSAVFAIENVLLAKITAERFRETLLRHPRVCFQLAQYLVSKLRQISHRVLEFSSAPTKIRVRAELLRYCEELEPTDKTVTIDPAPTHHEIATRISSHREAVSREISHLKSIGVLETHARKISFLTSTVCGNSPARNGLRFAITGVFRHFSCRQNFVSPL